MTDTATETVRQLLRDESTPEGRAFWAKVRAVGDTAPEWMKEKIRQAMSDEGDTSNPTETAADAVRPDLDGIEARAKIGWHMIGTIAADPGKFRMSIPPHENDTDMFIGGICENDIPALLAYCRRLEAANAAHDDALLEIEQIHALVRELQTDKEILLQAAVEETNRADSEKARADRAENYLDRIIGG